MNDVAIFAYYGSYATDEATENSDIDFFYIPKTEKSNALSIQFIVDGIGIDLFPISWDRIARIVSLDQPLTSVITKSKVLYASSPEEKEKYFFLKRDWSNCSLMKILITCCQKVRIIWRKPVQICLVCNKVMVQ